MSGGDRPEGEHATGGLGADPLKVLIADDHTIFRDGLRTLLESATGTVVAGEAASGEEAVALAESLQPDVVIMDIEMPGVNGIEATRRIVHHSPHIRILIVTMHEDDHMVFKAMRAGALGYVLKGAKHAEMLRAIRAVGHGEAIFSPEIATRMMEYFSNLKPLKIPRVLPELTDREREVLDLIARGHRNPEIAEELIVSPKTVSNHISNIFSKLQVADRAQAILRAREAGLG